MLLPSKRILCFFLTILLAFTAFIPSVVTAEEPAVLTMLGASINPDLSAMRFGTRYDASLLPSGATVVSLGMLIYPAHLLRGELAFGSDGTLEDGVANIRATGIANYIFGKSFDEYAYIDFYVVINNIPQGGYNTALLARGYIAFNYNGITHYLYSDIINRSYQYVYDICFPNQEYMRGMWVSQFDMFSVYLSGGVQRSKSSYTSLVETIVTNIKNDNYNTVFLQMRPYGDSFYESNHYPLSRFVAGSYGGSISYDPIEIFIEKANAAGLSIHGWINPMRLMTTTEIASVSSNYLIKQWYNAGSDRVVEVSGRLYLNPAYADVRKLIADGAAEILTKYNVDGIHIDDYFYPTTAASFDAVSYAASGMQSLSAFRENNLNLLVSGLYETVHATDSTAVFGVSPAGNLSALKSSYYVDVAKWCGQDGYLDYILPQLYFGFLHAACPFDRMVNDWSAIVTNPNVKYYVGLSGGSAFAAYNGEINVWAGTEAGKYEWINNKDVLKRSFEYIFADNTVDGYVFFCYQYLYNPITGTHVINLAEEYGNYIDLTLQ
ncbi:MAG: hypothetical protein CVU97_01690 [Firmicutes bacterium HGW-Firmicutes-21]|nr:MAG: hypothetical protein CVU97_01690 [Firmicutes bacterium HGW-Firmicutes-21]